MEDKDKIENVTGEEHESFHRLLMPFLSSNSPMPFTYYEPRTSVKVKEPLSKAQSKARKASKNARKARKKNR